MSTNAILFVKEPRPGQVKTRLQTHLSAAEAAQLYRAFVLDSVETLARSAAQRKVIAFAPIGAEEVIRELVGADFDLIAQPEMDLGGRMDGLMRWSFEEGAERTVIIGSDTPSLPVAYIDEAIEMLQERDVVLGPSTDGGYYLVGQKEGNSAIFTGIEWSTGAVLQQTLERLDKQSLGLLSPWYDVDTAPEAGFLKMHLEALHRARCREGRHSRALLEKLILPLPS
jgi:rSAM/selenodomain-associated transferase 1